MRGITGRSIVCWFVFVVACRDEALDEAEIVASSIEGPDGVEVEVEVRDGEVFLDGDIHLGSAEDVLGEHEEPRSAAIVNEWGRGLWPQGIVYFQIAPGYSASMMGAAMQHWTQRTGIRFVNQAHPSGYVTIGDFGEGCWATLGHQPGVGSRVSMDPGCDTFRAWVHEFGHVLGLYHEQSRTDSSAHINIHWANIRPESHYAFQRYIETGWNGVDLGVYDVDSVMHYPSWAFVKDPARWQQAPAITRKDGALINPSESAGTTSRDAANVVQMYATMATELFDPRYYLDLYPDLRAAFGHDLGAATQHWISAGRFEGRSGTPVFDTAWYLRHHRDLAATFGTNWTAGVEHWRVHGLNEGRASSLTFDVRWYLANNADLRAAFGANNYRAALRHWLDSGLAEGRSGSAAFDPAYYLQMNPDVAAAFGRTNYRAGLIHWLQQGRREGRVARR